MLKKIALTALFAITFAVGMGAAQAKTKAPSAPVPHWLCPCGIAC